MDIEDVYISESCLGGSIAVDVSGGLHPLTYTWSHGFVTNDSIISNLSEGDYNVTITDLRGCVVSGKYDIDLPHNSDDVERINADTSCMHMEVTLVYETDFNFETDYTTRWILPNGEEIVGINQDTLHVVVDSQSKVGNYIFEVEYGDCHFSSSNYINFTFPEFITPDTITVCVGDDVLIGGSIVTNESSPDIEVLIWYKPDGSWEHLEVDGGWVRSYETVIEGVSYGLGGEHVLVYSNGLCVELTESFFVEVGSPPVIDNIEVTEYPCSPQDDMVILSSVSGGNPPYTYYWNNGSTDSIATYNEFGVSPQLVVEDMYGCRSERYILPVPSFLQINGVNCG